MRTTGFCGAKNLLNLHYMFDSVKIQNKSEYLQLFFSKYVQTHYRNVRMKTDRRKTTVINHNDYNAAHSEGST